MAYKCRSYIERFNRKKKDFTEAGNPFFDQYEYKNIEGVQVLVKVEPVNRQEEIQSYAKSCDISNILNRFMNGEVELLNMKQGFYGDVSNMPTNYSEYFEKVSEAKEVFNGLPKDIKNAFDNNAEKFFSMYGSDEWKNIIRSFQPENENSTSVSASAKESEVVEDAK